MDAGAEQSLVLGHVVTPAGGFGVFDAVVDVNYSDDAGVPVHRQARTRWDGQFQLRGLPVGTYTFAATRGHHAGQASITVATPSQQITDATIQLSASGAKFVVVTGAWDRIEDIIGASGLGFDPVMVSGDNGFGQPADWLTPVADAAYLADVAAVFLNCGLDDDIFSRADLVQRLDTLRAYVAAGGSLYISDQAYDVAEALYPDAVEFYGNDANPNAAQEGDAEEVAATIVDRTLEKIVGHTVTISYDLSSWAVMESVPAPVDGGPVAETLVTGTVHAYGTTLPDVPLAVQITAGNGRVIYTTFHNEAQLDPGVRAILQFMVLSL